MQQRNIVRACHVENRQRHFGIVRDNDAGQINLRELIDLFLERSGIQFIQVINLITANHLKPGRMNEVQMADNTLPRLRDLFITELNGGAGLTRNPGQFEFVFFILEKLCNTNSRHWVPSR